jgi:DNA-binding transcriptional LysR family regulator
MKRNFTVRQGALDGVEAFLSVARHRSFRKAAAELGVTPSAMSQAVRALEARVGAALFLRTTRSVGLSEAGERFHMRARPAFEELVAASDVARDLGQRPAGLLRLTVPRAVVPILLEPLIASFCEAFPQVEPRSPRVRNSSISRPEDLMPASGSANSSQQTWSRCG